MPAAFAGSTLVDVVIAITALEALLLTALHYRTGRGIAPRTLLAGLSAGIFLMLGVRSVLVGAPWPWLAVCLACAGVAHACDLALRWRSR